MNNRQQKGNLRITRKTNDRTNDPIFFIALITPFCEPLMELHLCGFLKYKNEWQNIDIHTTFECHCTQWKIYYQLSIQNLHQFGTEVTHNDMKHI